MCFIKWISFEAYGPSNTKATRIKMVLTKVGSQTPWCRRQESRMCRSEPGKAWSMAIVMFPTHSLPRNILLDIGKLAINRAATDCAFYVLIVLNMAKNTNSINLWVDSKFRSVKRCHSDHSATRELYTDKSWQQIMQVLCWIVRIIPGYYTGFCTWSSDHHIYRICSQCMPYWMLYLFIIPYFMSVSMSDDRK